MNRCFCLSRPIHRFWFIAAVVLIARIFLAPQEAWAQAVPVEYGNFTEQAVTINFEGLPSGAVLSDQFAGLGLRFNPATAVVVEPTDVWAPPQSGKNVVLHADPGVPGRLDPGAVAFLFVDPADGITPITVPAVGIHFYTIGLVTLEVFDTWGNLLGTATRDGISFVGLAHEAGIASARLRTTSPCCVPYAHYDDLVFGPVRVPQLATPITRIEDLPANRTNLDFDVFASGTLINDQYGAFGVRFSSTTGLNGAPVVTLVPGCTTASGCNALSGASAPVHDVVLDPMLPGVVEATFVDPNDGVTPATTTHVGGFAAQRLWHPLAQWRMEAFDLAGNKVGSAVAGFGTTYGNGFAGLSYSEGIHKVRFEITYNAALDNFFFTPVQVTPPPPPPPPGDLSQCQQQLADAQAQIAQLQAQVAQLQADNAALQNQVAQLQQQVQDLQGQLTQLTTALMNGLTSLQNDLRVVFNDPTFVIPGATPLEQYQNLITAILNLNKGRKMGIYQNMGGKKP